MGQAQPLPAALETIEARAAALGFDMNSDREVGLLLAALAASKPGGRVLELGTGCGLGAAWLLHVPSHCLSRHMHVGTPA